MVASAGQPTTVHKINMCPSGTVCGVVFRPGVKRSPFGRFVTCLDCKRIGKARQDAARVRAAGEVAQTCPAKLWECRHCGRKYFGAVEAGGHTPPKCTKCGERSWKPAKWQVRERRA